MREQDPDIGPLGPVPDAVEKLERVSPPYRRPERWRWVPQKRLRSASGVLITLDPAALSEDDSSLSAFVGRFKRAYPAVPIVLQLGGGAMWDGEPTEVTSSVPSPHVRGFLRNGFDVDSYRALVGAYSTSSIQTWLFTARQPESLKQTGAVTWAASIVAGAESPIASEPASLRRHLGSLDLPTPHRWKMLRRALPCVLALQRDQCTVEIARRGRYPHTRSFERHCSDLFGEAPSTLRIWAGWEPLMARFTAFS